MSKPDGTASFTNTKANIHRTLTNTKVKATVMANKTSHLLVSLLSTVLTVVLVLAVSVFLYGTFYYAYMPVEMHHLPVHLQFQPCADTTTRCSNPTAQIALKRNQKLLQGQPYSISLKLDIPDSPVNEDHGMFMSCLKISSISGDQIGEACKSSISEYRSSLLRILETFTYSPALLTGWSAQKQEVHINYFSNFQTDPHTPAEVEIQSKHLQISEASLEIHAELKGLRHLMYRHPWFSSFLGVSSNILILTTIILVSWARFLEPEESTTSNTEAPVEDVQEEPATKDTIAAEKTVVLKSETPKDVLATSDATLTLAAKPSLGNRFKWFLLKLVFKLLLQSFKLFVLAAIAIVSYEAFMLGVDVDKPEVLLEATKEDIGYLAKFVAEKSLVLVELLKTKFM